MVETPKPAPQRPPPNFNVGGWRETGAIRIRTFLFWTILEEQRVYEDGTQVWVRKPGWTGSFMLSERTDHQ